VFRGHRGDDIMRGRDGNDIYYVDSTGDQVIETEDNGNDLVVSTVDYTLPDNVERLNLAGSDDLNGTGNALDNIIRGTGGDNILDGGEGADTLYGGKGDDTYVIDNEGDHAVEIEDGGIDTVQASIDYTLGRNLENLELTGEAVKGTGNKLDNSIVGNEADNELDGKGGDDTLDGGGGDDTLTGGVGADTFAWGAGNDVITDFNMDDGDMIEINVAGVTTWAQLLTHATQVGDDVVITIGNAHLTIEHLLLANLDQNHFTF
jgi:Ca2+-binding RTX toxin-like protein